MFHVNIVHHIEEIGKQDWDALVGDRIMASYGWLRTVEQTFSGKIEPIYFLLMENGRLVGGTVSYVFEKGENMLTLDDLVFGRLKKYFSKVRISCLPALICSPIKAYGYHFLSGPDADSEKKRLMMKALLEGILDEASCRRLPLVFNNVLDDETDLIRWLTERRFTKTMSYPLNYLDVEWTTFQDYLGYVGSISKNMKKNIKKEISKNRREGVAIKALEKLDGCEDRLYQLVNHNSYKHNKTPFPFRREFFRRLKENLQDDAVIYGAMKSGKIIGVTVLFKKGDTGYLPFVGVDHELAGKDCTYFNLTFYKPIEDAIADHLRRLYLGNAMYEMKQRRGARVKNSYVFYRPSRKVMTLGIKPWFALHQSVFSRKLPEDLRMERGI